VLDRKALLDKPDPRSFAKYLLDRARTAFRPTDTENTIGSV
jgi:hypothetical protein